MWKENCEIWVKQEILLFCHSVTPTEFFPNDDTEASIGWFQSLGDIARLWLKQLCV